MIRKLDLIAALQRMHGNPIVTLWDAQYKEDVDLRRVMLCMGSTPGDNAIVLTSEPITPRGLNVIGTAWAEDE